MVAQRDKLIEAVTRTDESEADVVGARFGVPPVCHLQDEVHPVLRPHHAEVGDEVRPAASEAGSAEVRRSRFRSGPVRTTVTYAGSTPSRSEDDVPVGVVGGDHMIGCPHGGTLHAA